MSATVRPGVAAAAVLCLAYMAVTFAVQSSAGIAYQDWFATAGSTWRVAVLSLLAGSALLAGALAWLRWDHLWRDPLPLPRRPLLRVVIWAWWLCVAVRLAGVEWSQVPGALLLAVLASGVLVGFAEELLFRGFMLRALRAGHGEGVAAAWTAVAFGLFHLPNTAMGLGWIGLVQVPLAALSGVALYAIRRHHGALWPAMIAHGAWDVSTFLCGRAPAAWLAGPSMLLQLLMIVLAVLVLVGSLRRERTQTALPPAGP